MLDATKLAAGRLKAAQRYPFLAVALYALTPHAAPGFGTFGVDSRWRLLIDPAVLDGWTVDEVSGVLLHEVAHVIRNHAARAKALLVDESTHHLWNIAADAEINDDLLDDGIPLPSPVTPKTLRLPRGKAAEFYYQRLLEHTPADLPMCDCGAGAHGVGEELHGRAQGLPVGISDVEGELLRRRVALAIRAAVGIGKQGGGWGRWADSLLTPVVDWRRLFASRLRGALNAYTVGRSDYLYRRPSRRQVPGVVLPSLVRPVPMIAVVIDTSGSMTEAMVNRAWSETLGMLSSLGVRREQLRVWSTDTVATRIAVPAGRKVELVGGGGTDMTSGIEAAIHDRPVPDLIVVLTDGETPWPVSRPSRPVVVGLVRHDRPLPWQLPEWAQVVEIPVDDLGGLFGS